MSCKKNRVVKRDGRIEYVQFDKITNRLEKLCYDLETTVINVTELTQSVVRNVVDMIHVSDIDDLAAMKCYSKCMEHPDYAILAGRICTSNLRKECPPTFYEAMKALYDNGQLNKETFEFIEEEKDQFNDMIDNTRDEVINYFSVQTLKKSYLMRIDDKIVETPQYMYLRVACGVHHDTKWVESVRKMYDMLSQNYYIHSSPTLFNSGAVVPQMASCFLLEMKDDSLEGIMETATECAKISKYAGGIGMHVNKIRSTGSRIAGTNGKSSGLIPFLKIYESTIEAFNQGGKRPGSIAVYLEPHHADFMEFMEIRKPERPEKRRAADIFTAVWLSELFMERVKNGDKWTFFDPNTNERTRMLENVFDDFDNPAYTKLYEELEAEGLGKETVNARDVWNAILSSQLKTGTPYLLNKDVINRTSNQRNIGVIKSSNLCTEIVEYSSPDETAVCTLASINLSKFVKDGDVDYIGLSDCAEDLVEILNKTIDLGFYPTESARKSHMRHRPIGIGVSGLQDLFFKLRIPFTSDRAKMINKKVFEYIYYGCLSGSNELARHYGCYETFKGSPASEGKLNFDLWGVKPETNLNWDELRERIKKYGLKNSLHVALMPTATSATIMGVTECFEPQKSNIFKRQVKAGEFVVVNKYLTEDLQKIGLWNEEIVDKILYNNGSVQNIKEIPQELKEIYKTAYELKMKDIIDMAADRSPWVDQAQSLNLFIEKLDDINKLTSMLMYSYNKKLKTLIYYLRIKPQGSDVKFTVKQNIKDEYEEDDEDICLSCQA